MGRSNKEARLNHSGMTIETGHGGMKRNMQAMGVGQRVGPRDDKDEGGSGLQRAKAGARARAGQKPQNPAPSTGDDSMEGKSGWDKIGQAGADIVGEYKRRKSEE